MTNEHGRSQIWTPEVPLVVSAEQVRDETAQTNGMRRVTAIDEASTTAGRIFLGFGIAPAGTRSAVHHHGEAETAVYCIRGRQRVYYGPEFESYIEFGEGDFAYIPPQLPHIEVNIWDEEYFGVLARSPSNIVVNFEDLALATQAVIDRIDGLLPKK